MRAFRVSGNGSFKRVPHRIARRKFRAGLQKPWSVARYNRTGSRSKEARLSTSLGRDSSEG
jgi:hypothetical protein